MPKRTARPGADKTPPGPEPISPPETDWSGRLESAIEREIADLVPEDLRGEAIERVLSVVRAEQFSGPLPHPGHLKAYEEILPGSAERIFAMAEADRRNHQEINRQVIEADIVAQRRGMALGLLVLLVLIGSIFTAGMLGNNTLAAVLAGTGVVGIVGAFIRGRND